MASGAGLNRVGQNGGEAILTVNPTTAAYATPLAGYGTVGSNDSGTVFWEAIGFTKTAIQLIGPGATAAGYTVSVYVTLDPAARPGGQPVAKGSTLVPATSWAVPPSQAAGGAAGGDALPLVTGTNTLAFISGPFVALRVVCTATATPTAAITVLAFAVP
jgi:hypothetical protein